MSDVPQSRDVGDIIRQHFQSGEFLSAFEAIYANAQNGGRVPWDDHAPNALLVEWLQREKRIGQGAPALVIGCGLGDDAEYLAAQGYDVTAFDISATAIQMCRERFPDSAVHYEVADLFALPDEWTNRFAFVLECRTIQALPWQMSRDAMTAIARCVKPEGELLVLCFGRQPDAERKGIPWPLSKSELAFFQTLGMKEISFEETDRGRTTFRVLYRKEG
jgi:SAM-dependent methyltransferase